MIDEILAYNQQFVQEKRYEAYKTSKYPDKKIAILSCMDTRLTELLPAALGIKNGDVKLIKNAGGTISHPFGSIMRSLLVAVYDLGVEEIMVIGHTNCGMQGLDNAKLLEKMKKRGIAEHDLALMNYCGVDFNQWLHGFDDAEESVMKTVVQIKEHPLMPKDVRVMGYMMDSETGELSRIEG